MDGNGTMTITMADTTTTLTNDKDVNKEVEQEERRLKRRVSEAYEHNTASVAQDDPGELGRNKGRRRTITSRWSDAQSRRLDAQLYDRYPP